MRTALALVGLLATGGCSLVRNADDVVVGDGADAASAVDSTLPDASDDSGAFDSTLPDTRVAETTADGNVAEVASDAGTPLDRRWAQWRMPSVTPTVYTTTDAVVTDTTTGLRWQRVVSAAGTYDAAAAACAALTLEGKKDYRLPTRIELISILAVAKGVKPAIQASAFPSTPAAPFWSASSSNAGRYVVDFADANVKTALGSEMYSYRCVASP